MNQGHQKESAKASERGNERGNEEERFKALRSWQKSSRPTFSAAILGHSFATFENVKSIVPPAPSAQPPAAPASEKERTLESLQKFVAQSEEQTVAVTFEGAKRALFETPKNETSVAQSFNVNDEIAHLKVLERQSEEAELLCAFVGHRLGDEWGEYDVLESADQMLERMIKAMGLGESEYALAPFKRHLNAPEEDPHWNSLLGELAAHRPKIVFLMGANVTGAFMGRKERISKLHGQVFKRDFVSAGKSVTLSLMPIFHPEYLLINTAMKKAAWEDFQKAMEIMRP